MSSETSQLSYDQIRYIARVFFDKYSNPELGYIDRKQADSFIKEVYKSMGIIYHGFKNEDADMIRIFSQREEGIYYDDVERAIMRYLTPFQHSFTPADPRPHLTQNFNTEKKTLFR